MSRLYLRFILLLLVIFTGPMLLIHTQPYDDHDLRELLLPADCPAPCFMGIRPGVTQYDEAIKLLQTNQWVAHVEDDMFQINWTWSDQAPSWITQDKEGEIFAPVRLVQTVTVYTELPLGSTRLMLGVPDMEIVDAKVDQKREYAYYYGFYSQSELSIQSWQPCNGHEALRETVILSVSASAAKIDIPNHINYFNDLFRAC